MLGAKTKSVLLAVILGCSFTPMGGCIHKTVVPVEVVSKGASYSGAVRDSGIKDFKEGYVIFDKHSKDRYNALIEKYGNMFSPELEKDSGITLLPDGTYAIDNQHFTKAVQMNIWRKSGVEPIKKSLVEQVKSAL